MSTSRNCVRGVLTCCGGSGGAVVTQMFHCATLMSLSWEDVYLLSMPKQRKRPTFPSAGKCRGPDARWTDGPARSGGARGTPRPPQLGLTPGGRRGGRRPRSNRLTTPIGAPAGSSHWRTVGGGDVNDLRVRAVTAPVGRNHTLAVLMFVPKLALLLSDWPL